MQRLNNIKVGIGFATGRRNFQRVLRTNIYTWKESGLVKDSKVSLNLIVAYDLKYQNTKKADFTEMHSGLVEHLDSRLFIGATAIKEEMDYLVRNNVLTINECQMIFGKGYAAKRMIL